LVYCLNADGRPYFLHGFSFNKGGWAAANLSSYATGQSSLPQQLHTQGAVAVPDFPDYVYLGPATAPLKSKLVSYFKDPKNYNGSFDRKTVPDLGPKSGANPRAVSSLLAAAAIIVAYCL
jgi:hypothetical protein